MSNAFYPAVVMELSEDDGGGFAAYAPDLYGCLGDGETPEAALADLQNAIVEWCDEMRRLGREIPAPGSMGDAVASDRQALLEIIEKQAEILETQDRAFVELQQQVRQLTERVEAVVLRGEHAAEFMPVKWSTYLLQLPVGLPANTKSIVHN